MPAEANPWDSQSVAVGAIPCRIIDHHTSSTRIVCVTGPWPPFADSAALTVTVQVFGLIGGAQIAQMADAFQYRFDNTPWIQWGSHWAASGGDVLRFGVRTMHVADAADQIEVRIGDVLCEADPEERPIIMYGYAFFGLDCRLPLSEMLLPGHYNVSMRLRVLSPSDADCSNSACEVFSSEDSRSMWTGDGGWGYGVPAKAYHAWSWARNMWQRRMWQFRGTVDLASGSRSEFTVFPRVDAVEPAAGSVYGGNLVTLRGSSFSPVPEDNVVMLGGVPCEVVSASMRELRCRPRSSRAPDGGAAYAPDGAPRGLMYRSYKFDDGSGLTLDIPDASEARPAPYESGVLQTGIDFRERPWMDPAETDYHRESVGYFVPPATGNYTWFAAADDRLSIAIGEDETTESLREVLRLNQFRGVPREPEDSPATFYYFAQDAPDPLWPSERQQISEPVELLAGRRYAFRLRFVQQDRVDYQRIALKVSGLSPSSEAARLSAAASPAMELQRLRLRASPALKRETWLVRVADGREGFWMTLVGSVTQSRSYIRGGTDMMGFCNEVKKSLNDIAQGANSCHNVQCSRAAAGDREFTKGV